MNWTDCELAKRCSTFCTFGCLVWHRIGSCVSQGNREKERCHLDLPCQWWPSEGSFGALACFPEEAAVAPWGLELLWPPLASVFPKVPLAQAPRQQLGPNQRGERRPVRAGPSVGEETIGCGPWQELPCR